MIIIEEVLRNYLINQADITSDLKDNEAIYTDLAPQETGRSGPARERPFIRIELDSDMFEHHSKGQVDLAETEIILHCVGEGTVTKNGRSVARRIAENIRKHFVNGFQGYMDDDERVFIDHLHVNRINEYSPERGAVAGSERAFPVFTVHITLMYITET